MLPNNISFRPFFRWKHGESYYLSQSYPQRFKHFCTVSPANYAGTMAPAPWKTASFIKIQKISCGKNRGSVHLTNVLRPFSLRQQNCWNSFSGDAPNCSFDFQIFTWSFSTSKCNIFPLPLFLSMNKRYFPSPFQPATSQHVASSLGNVSAPQKWKILERIACLVPPLLPWEVTSFGRDAICPKLICKNSLESPFLVQFTFSKWIPIE